MDIPWTKKNKEIEIIGAAENNLKNIDVKIPLNKFVVITGVSGSGKSTLIYDVLYSGLTKYLGVPISDVGAFTEIKGADNIDEVEIVDQSPIGKTPRSNPATYTGVFDLIRKLFSMTREAKIRGYKPGRFSFNVKGGRCEYCMGQGTKKIEMHFLPDVYVTCQNCNHGLFRLSG